MYDRIDREFKAYCREHPDTRVFKVTFARLCCLIGGMTMICFSEIGDTVKSNSL